MPYDDIVIPPVGTGISRASFGIPVKNAINDLDARIGTTEGSTRMKPDNQSYASQTTYQNDEDIFFDLGPNAAYKIDWTIFCQSTSAADIKFQWVAPSGIIGGFWADDGTALNTPGVAQWNGARVLQTTGAPTVDVWRGTGGIVTGVLGGTLRLQHAQNASSATNTIVFIGSYATLTRVAILS